jgi:hypothetical protein
VKLGRSEVQPWLDEVAPDLGFVRLAQIAQLPRLRVTQQVGRGSVAPSTIAAIARGLKLDPLTELSRFQVFAGLSSGAPSPQEIAAFIPTPALLQATVHRLTAVKTEESELGNEFYDRLPLNWFNLADDGNLRPYILQEVGVTQPTLWKMLRMRLREDVSLAIAAYANFSPASALVVSGVLNGAEAGWGSGCRAQWVNTVPLGQLLEEAEKRLHEVGRHERSRETFENHLG